jgi:uncharacterized protein (DUF885 family)
MGLMILRQECVGGRFGLEMRMKNRKLVVGLAMGMGLLGLCGSGSASDAFGSHGVAAASVSPAESAAGAKPEQGTGDLEGRRKKFGELLAEEWEYEMKESPEFATAVGDYRYNDKWRDLSLAHVPVQREDIAKWLKRFEAVDTTGFPEQEILSEKLMLRNLKERLEAIDLKLYLMPVDQFNGIHLTLATFVSFMPFNTTKEYEDYLARLHKIPQVLDQVTEILQEGEKEKLQPPAYLLDKTVTQCGSIAGAEGEASPFGQPLKHFPAEVSAADQKRLHDAIVAAIDAEVRPAYQKLQKFLAAEYAPKGRKEEGLWALPNGDALYRFYVRQQTTTNMDPETIHQLGLKEVARVQGDQLAIAKKL